MIVAFRRSCARYRAVLIDYVDRGERGPHSEAAFDHVFRCTRCRGELERFALTIIALKRLSAATAGAEPSADAWPRLRARLQRPRVPGWSSAMQIGSLVASTWVVALVTASGLLISPGGGIGEGRGVEAWAGADYQAASRGAIQSQPGTSPGEQYTLSRAAAVHRVTPDGNGAASRGGAPRPGRQVPRK